uniref:C3H1-type domain-containing protein n=1 Tax=Magallana gigas TaxID=29159 RepID=A0A8W8MFZ0_MAGGI
MSTHIEKGLQPPQQASESFNIPSVVEESNFNLFDINDYQPVQTLTIFDPLGGHIPPKLKQKFWEGKFIDLALLLKFTIELANEIESKEELQIREGKMCLRYAGEISYKRTETVEIYAEYPHSASKSTDWYKYDEQFRLRKASDPHTSWGQINTKLWLLFVGNDKSPLNSDQPQNPYTSPIKYQRRPNTICNNYFCNLYNSGKQCRFYPNCRFKHSCKYCDGTHAAINCD